MVIGIIKKKRACVMYLKLHWEIFLIRKLELIKIIVRRILFYQYLLKVVEKDDMNHKIIYYIKIMNNMLKELYLMLQIQQLKD
jgi:hypothetical protein